MADPLAEARIALERNPQDSVAHGVAGRILCFGQERWDEGLEHLAQCDTPALVTIAQNEIAAWPQPAEARPGEILRVAKAWCDLGRGGFLPKAESEAVGRHSVDLYRQIVAEISQDRDVVTANEWLDRDDAFRVAVNNVRPEPATALPVEIADSGKQSDEPLHPSEPTAAVADAQNPSPPAPDHAPITPPNEVMPGGSVDRLSVVLAELDSAKIVAFPNVRISSVKRLASMYPGGAVGVGQVARLEQGESHAPLPESLAAFDRYEMFVHSKTRLINEITGRLKPIAGGERAVTYEIRRSAEAATLQKVQGETAEMVAELRKIEGPIAPQLNALISAYGSACDIISNADQDRLAEICTALKTKAHQENGYAESILWTLAEIRRGGDISEASAALVRHAPRVRSSNTLRRSVLNMNLTGLLILCETGEDVSDIVRFLKTDAAVKKDAAAMYVVALDAIAKRSKFKLEEALRTLKSIRSKVKGDAALRGLASAEAIFLELTASDRHTLEDVAEMRDEVKKYWEQFPNRAARDWQVHQALATIALLEGDREAASRHVAAGRACAPPLGMKSLDGLSAAIDKGHRYLIDAGE